MVSSQLADWFRGEGRKCIRDLDYNIKFRLFVSYKDIQTCSVQKAAVIFDKKPKDALNILGVAAYLALYEGKPTDLEPSQDLVSAPNRRIEVRILDHDVSAMKHLKANSINSFISVRGTVVRVR
jgi:DNA replicative helicase MCM subunit Mcm2 (Cdc46/Mcm family)